MPLNDVVVCQVYHNVICPLGTGNYSIMSRTMTTLIKNTNLICAPQYTTHCNVREKESVHSIKMVI